MLHNYNLHSAPLRRILPKYVRLIIMSSILLTLNGCGWSRTIRPVGKLELSRGANSVILRDGYAFTTDGYTGLTIVDLHDEKAPKLVAEVEVDPWVSVLAQSKSYVYLGTRDEGIFVINVSDPSSPTIVSHHKEYGSIRDIAVYGDIAFVSSNGFGGLMILDISDPAQPLEINRLRFKEYVPRDRIGNITLSGQWMYVDLQDGPQLALDITDPQRPTIVSVPLFSEMNPSAHPFLISIHDDYGYGNTLQGFSAVDLSLPANPKVIASVNTPEYVTSMMPYGNYLYVASLFAFRVYDISDPSDPHEVAHYDVKQGASVDAEGNFAILADKDFGLYIFEIRRFNNH